MGRTIDNGDNIIDSRDVIRRVEELETERQDLADAVDEAQEARDAAQEARDAATEGEDMDAAQETLDAAAETLTDAEAALTEWDDSDEARELAAIKAFAEEGADNLSDWSHGETLIADHYFTQYAQELAEDIGAVGTRDVAWPLMYIDWDAAADALKADYTSLTWDGAEYWGRS